MKPLTLIHVLKGAIPENSSFLLEAKYTVGNGALNLLFCIWEEAQGCSR